MVSLIIIVSWVGLWLIIISENKYYAVKFIDGFGKGFLIELYSKLFDNEKKPFYR